MGWLIDIFGPRWKHSNYIKRRDAVEQIANQEILLQIARRDLSHFVRQAAVERLADQSAIAKIAVTDCHKWVRQVAVRKLSDQCAIAEIAVRDHDKEVRLTATRMLDDSVVLSGIAKADVDAGVRAAAARKLSDPKVLAEIAKDPDPSVRRAVVERFAARHLLAEIAQSDTDSTVRQAAVAELEDQIVLAAIASKDSDAKVARGAFAKLTDPALFTVVAKNAHDSALGLAALAKLTDQISITEVATQGQVSAVREAAITKLTDQTSLAEIAAYSWRGPNEFMAGNTAVGLMALERVKENGLLEHVFRNSEDSLVRERVIEMTQDQTLLSEAGKNDSSERVRFAAARKIRDPELTQTIYMELAGTDSGLSRSCVELITSETALLDLTRKAFDPKSRMLAVARLTKAGWALRILAQEGCRECGGLGIVYLNLDSAFDRDVDSYLCGCGGKADSPYLMTVSCEKDGQAATLNLSRADLNELEDYHQIRL